MDDLFDDPINDLLSEGSNDSFFEEKPKKSTKPITDVFNLDDKKDQKPTIPEEKIVLSVEKEIMPRQRKNSFEKTDVSDLLDTQETKKSKSSIMNEILGISNKPEEKVSTFDDILKGSSVKNKPVIENKKITEREEIEKLLISEPRRRRGSTNLDPLGLLDIGTKSPEMKKKIEPTIKDLKNVQSVANLETSDKAQHDLGTKTSKSVSFLDKEPSLISEFSTRRRESPKKQQKIESGLPDWLQGSGTSIQSKNIEPAAKPASTDLHEERIEKVPTETKKDIHEVEKVTQEVIPVSNVFDSILKQQSSNLEIQSSSISLQQQESQLLMALQLKKYEQNLVDMQKTQQDILVKQEKQFNLLLEKQFEKQKSIEENMRLQQERINQHIQLLLSQPVSSNLKQSFDDYQKKEDLLRDTFEDNRNFYNDIISSLKQKHNEEIAILEESYKKQITFLESSLESTEIRLKTEIDSINKYYIEKLNELTLKQEELINNYEEKIKSINKSNETMVNEIKNNYNELIQEIKSEYKTMLTDLNSSKNKEKVIFDNAGMFREKLNESLEILKENTNQVGEIQSSILMEKNILNDIKAGSLSAKEQEIKLMQESLEKQKIASDNERAQLLALIKTLEIRLVEQTQAARDERWSLQHATAIMSARAVAMDREIEYLKKNLEHEREQLKVLKETQLAEHEKVMLQLTEEKLAISAERSRLETASKLSQNYDLNKSRTEIEAALQVAKEATDLTDREREKLYKQQSEVETLKRILFDKEKKLELREREIENVTKIADQKFKDGERALIEARSIENKCQDKMKDIQRHSISLTNREKKLAEEKIQLSKERMSIHNNLNENRCGLCKVDVYQNENDIVEQDHSESYKVQDLELMRLRFELDDNIPTSIRDND